MDSLSNPPLALASNPVDRAGSDAAPQRRPGIGGTPLADGSVSHESAEAGMLRCTMNALTPKLKLGLDDLLADLWYARRSGDLGRLALVSYYEVRRWAKMAGDPTLVEHSSVLLMGHPHPDRDSFLADADRLIGELETLREEVTAAAPLAH
ncbi:hypothetical protein CATMQ487_03960 [Sphaerotilus microaerophilus]|uniref:Uncharacterized protein n=2 Tax=Sphaerotilus microaerophilus TaxID=2914710 RepID=A0ABN6PEK8_9BURK|nr:hypothetical protein CATMQ487_03960 [Sphaerotilus sp. FB-5]